MSTTANEAVSNALEKRAADTKQVTLNENSETETGLRIIPRGRLARANNFAPTNLSEAMEFAKLIADSDLAPRDFKGKPANVLIAMQLGAEVGLSPMAAIQNIAIINGRPSLWGDAALAVVQAHPDYEFHKEWMEGEALNRVAIFQIKRRNHEIHETRFSVAKAQQANLWGKDGPWRTYPERMLQWRARGYGLRDKFSDALRGMITAEEAADIPPDDVRDLIGQDMRLAAKSQSRLDEVKARYAQPMHTPVSTAQSEVVHTEPVKQEPAKQEQVADSAQAEKPVLEQLEVTVLKVDPKSKAITAKQKEENKKRREDAQHQPQPYYLLKCDKDITLFVWDQHLHSAVIKSQKKKCVFAVSRNEKGFVNVEDVISIDGVKFARDPETKDAVPAELLAMTERATARMDAGGSAAPQPAAQLYSLKGHVTHFKKTNDKREPLKDSTGAPFVAIKLAYLPEGNTNDPHNVFLCYKPSLFAVLELSEEEDVEFVYSKKSRVETNGETVKQLIEDVRKVGNRSFEAGKPAAEDEVQSAAVSAEDENQDPQGIQGLFP